MADMLSDPTLHTEHAAIRHDIGLAEANIRDKVGNAEARLEKAVGDTRYTVAQESGNLSRQIGQEACAISAHIGDARKETATGFADTRYNVAEQANNLRGAVGDVRQEQAENFGHTRRDLEAGFGDVRYNLAERTGDIRREVAAGIDKTGDLVAATSSDIRLEQQKQAYDLSRQSGAETNEIVKEGLKGTHEVFAAIKDNRYDLASRIENAADRSERGIAEVRGNVADRFFAVGRDLSDLKQGHATLSKDIELNGLRTQLDAKQNTQYLNDKITNEGDRTRALIQDLKYHDLNRGLVERNTELVNCKQDRHHYHDRWLDGRFDQNQAQFAGQWAQLQSQIQAFQSQLQETRQGMVNFGTMAGVGQSSTSNNVR